MDIAAIGKLFDIGIIIGIVLLTQFIKDRLYSSQTNAEVLKSKLVPFVPLILGIVAGFLVVFKSAAIPHTAWNISFEAIKYAGAATFAYKLYGAYGQTLIDKIIQKKLSS